MAKAEMDDLHNQLEQTNKAKVFLRLFVNKHNRN